MQICAKRLKVEHINCGKDPVPYVTACPLTTDIREWRFLIRGSGLYEGGFYQGKLKFPADYPLNPPSILFITPSGRFAINTRICLSISDFHPETWSPAWTVSSILTGVVSFMNSNDVTTGSVSATEDARKALAISSIAFNAQDPICMELFGDPIELFERLDFQIARNTAEKIAQLAAKSRQQLEDQRQSSSSSSLSLSSSSSSSNIGSLTSRTAACTLADQGEDNDEDVVDVVSVTSTLTKSAKKRLKEKERDRAAQAAGAVADEP